MYLNPSGERAVGRRRPAFTLLELLLAMVVGLLLLGALYAALGVQLHHAQVSREVVDQSALARALLARMAGDLALSLAPQTAPSAGSLSQNGSGAAGGSSDTTAPGTASGTAGSGAFAFGAGVQGDTGRLTMYTSRLPPGAVSGPNDAAAAAPGADLRRITYWQASSGGLARQEVVLVTSDNAAANVPPNVPDEGSHVIAPEVRNLTLSYFDGSSWQESWDGSTPGPDGRTPIGPPLAVAITLDVALPASDGALPAIKTYRHVVAVPTAGGSGQSQSTGTTGP